MGQNKLRNFRLDDDRWNQFQELAKQRDTSASAEIVRFVDLYLAGFEFPESPSDVAPKSTINSILERIEALEGKRVA
jgi:hypothetical protein